VAVLAAGLGLAVSAPAMANSIFLKIPGITGPVTTAAFAGDIQLTAYSQGFTDPATVYFVGSANGTTPANVPYTIVLSHVRVTSITQGDTVSHTSGLGITENISMIAEKFTFTYRSVGPDGVTGKVETFTWDCATNSTT
jgi:type VI protein secretion system component Hcp